MACANGALVGKLKDILQELEGGCRPPCPCPQPTCPPTDFPFAACCMVCPPPILAPTSPEPVKPLQLPCPFPSSAQPEMSPEEAEATRYANFYNNYNIDYHDTDTGNADNYYSEYKAAGVTVDGKNPLCKDKKKKKKPCDMDKGCPTGFKPCTMKLTPPPNCHPCGVWCAQIQPCPPKKKVSQSQYNPGPCKRPCCKHWKPKDGECKYDGVCKAHCFATPPRKKSVRSQKTYIERQPYGQ